MNKNKKVIIKKPTKKQIKESWYRFENKKAKDKDYNILYYDLFKEILK